MSAISCNRYSLTDSSSSDNENRETPQFEWAGLQNLFLDETESDVVFIIDCCQAGSSIRFAKHRNRGVVQLLAACGFETSTALDGKHTFTANLVTELQDIAPEGANLPRIHTNLNNRLKRWLPIAKQEKCVTAVLFLLADTEEGGHICIKSLPKASRLRVKTTDAHQINTSSSSVTSTRPIKDSGPNLGHYGAVDIKDSASCSDTTATRESPLSHYSSNPATEPVSVKRPLAQAGRSDPKGGNTAVRSRSARKLEDSPTIPLEQSHHLNPDAAAALGSDSSDPPTVRSSPTKQFSTMSLDVDDALERFVSSLYFPEMRLRSKMIATAYEETFTWALAEESSFMNWLLSDDPIFWVSGKAGSGKSTFMKFIHSSQRVQEQLSHTRPVEIFSPYFFFWNSGSAREKSLRGFLGALLYQMVKENQFAHSCLALWLKKISEADYLHLIKKQTDRSSVSDQHANDLLKIAILSILKDNANELEPTVWFILIDAMDECDEREDAFESLTSFVLHMAEYPLVKLCVSSRPWISFQSAFDRFPTLRVQDLTFSDIYKYVFTSLEAALGGRSEVYGKNSSESLARAVASQSQGVFLWASLVVRSLIEGFQDGDTVEELWSRFNRLPNEMEALYLSLLKNVQISVAAKVFSVVQTSQWLVIEADSNVTFQPNLTVRGLFFALFQDTTSVLDTDIVPITQDEARRISAAVSKSLEIDTAGLVTIDSHHTSIQSTDNLEYTIRYTHKSVPDFLATKEADSLLQPALSNFDPHLALLRSFVLQLKTLEMGATMDVGLDELQRLKCWSLVEAAVRYAKQAYLVAAESSVDRDSITLLLDTLDSTMAVLLDRWSSGSIQGHWSQFLPLGRPRIHKWEDSFLSFATSWNLYDYIEDRRGDDQKLVRKPGRPLLNYAITPMPGSTTNAANVEAVLLLMNAGVDPNERFGGESVWRRFLQVYYKFEAYKGDSDNSYLLRLIYERLIHDGADPGIAYRMAFAGERAHHGVPLPELQPE